MITVRISFEKKNEASYISLLDMQRVMQRVLKRSSLPVWHTLGFNPHIYMTFACPLSLGQESACECVDVKTEAEAPDFEQWKTALNAIMPAGIVVTKVAPVEKKSKRKVKTVELKEFVPSLDLTEEGEQVRFSICLPASQELTLNPALLTAALEETFGVPAAEASILRTHFLTAEKTLFA